MKESVIYDFETLGQNAITAPVISLAILKFDHDRFIMNPYTFEELLNSCSYYKFDVEEQVKKYSRVIEKGTLEWWSKQDPEIRHMMVPAFGDYSISRLYDILFDKVKIQEAHRVYTRGCGFDTTLMLTLIASTGKVDPTKWWSIRDTRSVIEGMTIGSDIRHDFVPPDFASKFKKHDPNHDISLDVLRMQYLTQVLLS